MILWNVQCCCSIWLSESTSATICDSSLNLVSSRFIAAVVHTLLVNVIESNDGMGEFGEIPGVWAVKKNRCPLVELDVRSSRLILNVAGMILHAGHPMDVQKLNFTLVRHPL